MTLLSENQRKPGYKSFLWNSIGGIVSAASSFVLLLCVTRTAGAAEGGIFSLAFATSQILLTIGKFGVRSYQATDVTGEIPFGIYLQTRIWFCFGMLLSAAFYVLCTGYDIRKAVIFLLVTVLKMADAVEDVFHGQLQSLGYLDTAGKLLTVRNLFTMLLFGLCMVLSKDLLWACAISAEAGIGVTLLLNLAVTRQYTAVVISFEKEKSLQLLKACAPLFAGSFLSLYIYNAPKYAIDLWGTEEEITYYSVLFMPTFVINLFSEFAFKPLLTVIASMWQSGEFRAFGQTVRKLIANVFVIGLVLTLGAWLAGAQILSWFYAVDITGYRGELTLLMISGGLSAAVYLLYNVLTSMRRQKMIILNYLAAAVAVTALSCLLVEGFSVRGAAAAYFISEALLFLFMLAGISRAFRKGKKRNEDRNYNLSGDQ